MRRYIGAGDLRVHLFQRRNLYLIDNGKVTEPPQALVRALGKIAATTISVMMEQSMQTAVTRSF